MRGQAPSVYPPQTMPSVSYTPPASPQGNLYTVPFGSSGNLTSTVGSTYIVDNSPGYCGIAFTMVSPGTGSVLFEGTFDGANWFGATMRRTTNNGYVQTTTGTDNYLGSIAGMQAFRARVTQPGATAGSIMGTLQRTQHTLEGIEVGSPDEFYLSVASNKVAGHRIVNKFGRNPNITIAGTPADIWNGGGAYQGFPTGVSGQLRVFSNLSGDAAAGFGARTLTVFGLDPNYNEQSEQFTLNGTNPVTGNRAFVRVHTSSVNSAGASGQNLGEITCQLIPPNQSATFFRMPTGTNQTYCSAYTVPAGKTAYIQQIYASLNRGSGIGVPANREADIAIYTRTFGGVFRLRRPSAVNNNSALDYSIVGGLAMSEKTDLIIRCTSATSDGSNLDISAGYDMVLVDS